MITPQTEVLLKEFEIRWQEMLALQNAMSTWSTTYVTAVFLTIGWIIGRRGSEHLTDIFKAHNDGTAVLVLTLAAVNGLYLYGMMTMNYRLHELAQYIEDVIAPEIRSTGTSSFNAWEVWRRTQSGTWTRNLFAFLQFTFPVILSIAIFSLYLKYGWAGQTKLAAVYAYAILLFTAVCIIGSGIMYFQTRGQWKRILSSERGTPVKQNPRDTPKPSPEAKLQDSLVTSERRSSPAEQQSPPDTAKHSPHRRP